MRANLAAGVRTLRRVGSSLAAGMRAVRRRGGGGCGGKGGGGVLRGGGERWEWEGTCKPSGYEPCGRSAEAEVEPLPPPAAMTVGYELTRRVKIEN